LLKPSENPPVSWPAGLAIKDFKGLWWVAHTKSRNEKALAQDMSVKGISYFLPMIWKVRRVHGRTMRSLLPLFGGYLFFCGEERQRIEVLRTNRVANLIEVRDQPRLVRELSQIEQALCAGADLTPHKFLKEGQRCKVIGGALAGLQGIVVRANDQTRLVLQIDMLGQATSVEISADMIEPVEENETH
jgi:transcription antitermination factor NusG